MEIPLTLEQMQEGLQSVFKETRKAALPTNMIAAIKKVITIAEESQKATEDLEVDIKKMKERGLVRITSFDVPESILPTGYTATLNDVKVNSRGPDDKIYFNHPEVRKRIARGTTTMKLSGPESWFDFVVYANKKFTGGIGDEDETQPENDDIWREFCLEPPENANEIVCMEKLNGEAAHFSGRFIKDIFYLITGSKNTHMLIKDKNDIKLYGEDRFTVARTVAEAVCDVLEGLNPRKRHILYSFLHHTKTTAICEILQPDYQHIVDLSYLDKPQLNFIAFTPTASVKEETSLTALPPHHTLNLALALGLCCAPYTLISPQCIKDEREKIRKVIYKEGEVLYYLNDKGETFGIAKAKSVWYILLRALREKAVYTFTTAKKRDKNNWNLQDRIASVYKRFDEIQKWLKLTDSCMECWKKLAAEFIKWLHKEIEGNHLQGGEIRPNFPKVWKKYLTDTNQVDIISL